ncbi:MAG: hypothetical protein ACKPCP_25675 [Sphaerospermopsis kisseleviana]
MKVRAICNLECVTPSHAEGASWRVKRSHLNQFYDGCYPEGAIFAIEYIAPSGELWLKDKNKNTLFVPLGEVQCFEDI